MTGFQKLGKDGWINVADPAGWPGNFRIGPRAEGGVMVDCRVPTRRDISLATGLLVPGAVLIGVGIGRARSEGIAVAQYGNVPTLVTGWQLFVTRDAGRPDLR